MFIMRILDSIAKDYNPEAEAQVKVDYNNFLFWSFLYPSYKRKPLIALELVLLFYAGCTSIVGLVFLVYSVYWIFPTFLSFLNIHYFLVLGLLGAIVPYYRSKRLLMTEMLVCFGRDVYIYAEYVMEAKKKEERAQMALFLRRIEKFTLLLYSIGGFVVLCFNPVLRKTTAPTREEERLFERGVCLDLPLPILAPFDCEGWINWLFLFYLEVTAAVTIFPILFGATLYFVGLCVHLNKHLRILKWGMDNLNERASAYYTQLTGIALTVKGDALFEHEGFLECYKHCFQETIKHYSEFRRLYTIFMEVIWFPLFIILFNGSILLALSGIQLTAGMESKAMMFSIIAILAIEMCLMWICCYTGETISSLHSEFQYSVYNIQWYNTNCSLRKNVLIALRVSLTDLTMDSFISVKGNMETFRAILNAAYSYINVLMAMK